MSRKGAKKKIKIKIRIKIKTKIKIKNKEKTGGNKKTEKFKEKNEK